MCTDLDKTKRGVGLQNFKYAPAWDELCHIIYIVSPRAYRILRSYFPARTPRSFRYLITLGLSSPTMLLNTYIQSQGGP